MSDRPALARWRTYPAYKDSGVPWLGQIPAHWGMEPLKYVAHCLDGQRIPLNSEERAVMQGDYPYWGANCIVDHVDKWLFDEDLVLLGEDGAPFFDRTKDVAFFVRGRIWVNNHAHVLRAKSNMNPRFLAYVLNVVEYRAFIAGSTRDKLTQAQMNTIPIQQPSLPEQRAIAAFLDRETAHIDALLAKKERLQQLLAEKRTTLISHAVTRGLDASAPLKESGVPWLGKIPVGWTTLPIKRLASRGYKTFTDGDWIEAPYITRGGVRLIQTGNIGTGSYKEQGFRFISEETFRLFRCTEVMGGDILICRLAEPVGRACLAPYLGVQMITSVDVCILKPASEYEARYIVYVLSSQAYLDWMQAICRGSTRDRVSRSMLGDIALSIPPLPEQRAIADFLDRETAKLDALAAKVGEGMERLREYRAALIAAAVTGKVDVRGSQRVGSE